MTRLRVDLARPGDDAALRHLLATNPMEGSIELAFLREPNYFLASSVQAPFHQVVVARDGDAIVGAGLRGIRTAYVNGVTREIGYLGDLRLAEAYRGGTLVARGYRFLRDLHADGRAKLYLTVIAGENERALRTIAAGRAGLPSYRPLGRIFSPAVRMKPVAAPRAIEVRRAEDVDRDELEACLARNLRRKQFAPVLSGMPVPPPAQDGKALTFYAALRNGRVAGALAAWDQSSFKQTQVVRYHGVIRLLRPLLRYPRAGERLRFFYVAFIAIDDDDRDLFAALLSRVVNDRRGDGYHYFVAGLHERDPLLPLLRALPSTPFWARAFAVHFEDGAEEFEKLDGRVPYVELAIL
ncbi:MAG TPA: hypothetical protein VNL91_01135 [Thermoanaerobaculia bacterium]|nr:hypothetical protein [Thermoanaerobaculia bacterium]